MNGIEEALQALTTAQQGRLRVLWQRLEERVISIEEFITVATNVVLSGNARGYALGAATVRSVIEAAIATPEVTPVAVGARHLDPDRIRAALVTVLGSDLDTIMQLERLADNEPKQAATDGSGDAIKRSRHVRGWVRALDADACELCTWWWREGRVWHPDHPMPRHTGCGCEQRPVVRRTTNYQSERQAAERARERRTA